MTELRGDVISHEISGIQEPMELYREPEKSKPFPVESLGVGLADAAQAIGERVQCPLAMAGQSLLAAATMVAQLHINIQLPTGSVKPTSLYLLSIGESGERKSSCDQLAMKPVFAHEEKLRQRHSLEYFHWQNEQDAWEKKRKSILQSDEGQAAALNALGASPPKPLEPILSCEEPTFAALCLTLSKAYPGIGIFSDEGGEFIGGHAMRDESKLRTISGLSKLWDGREIKRIRAGEGNSTLVGKRLSMYLMIQPGIAQRFLSDGVMLDQGFLSRFLVTYPSSTMGTRYTNRPTLESGQALERYYERLTELLSIPLRLSEDGQNSLILRTVTLSAEAKVLIENFYDAVESELHEHGLLRPISGFANKVGENAIRLAAVLAFFNDAHVTCLSGEDMARGITLAQYYLDEACRLFSLNKVDEQLVNAKKLLGWLQGLWAHPIVSLTDILQRGPNMFRDRPTVEPLIQTLCEYGWLRATLPCEINGKLRREVYQIVSKE